MNKQERADWNLEFDQRELLIEATLRLAAAFERVAAANERAAIAQEKQADALPVKP